MIKYSDRYYINGIQITSNIEVWLKESDLDYIDHSIKANLKGAEVRVIRRRDKSENIVIDENIRKIASIQAILHNVNFKEELDKCSKAYVSRILYQAEIPWKRGKTHYTFSGYYDAFEKNKKGYIYSLSLEKIVYEEDGFEWDRDKCKELQVHISKDGKEKIEGDKSILLDYPKFERHRAAFFKHCEKEFAKCKGAFHLVKDKK